jgi:putative ABC transport system permease protein
LGAPSQASALSAGGRTSSGSLRSRTRSWLIVAEVALAVVLVAGSTLLLRSLDRLLRVDPGFDPAGVLVLTVTTPASRYPADADRTRFRDALLERASTLPGVTAVASTQSVPFFADYVASLFIDGDNEPADALPSANFYAVSPGYFDVMGIPLLRGRDVAPTDDHRSPRVALVSRQLALKVFGSLDVIGRQIRPSQGPGLDFAEIIGVVDDVRQYGLDQDATLQIYEPARQHPYFSSQQLLVRTDQPADRATAMVRAAVQDIDPLLPVSAAMTLSSALTISTGPRRFTAALLGGLAAIALMLAAVGVYALVSFSVGRRVQEFGVRLALGAEPRSIMRMVVGQGLRLALLGVAIGVAGALALSRFIEALLFDVSAHDPVAFGIAAVVLVAAALAASAAPARRALRVDPVTALRQS